jgi:hypothetical protein
MNWYQAERDGWSWATGWNHYLGTYYAQAWRDLPKPVRVEGRLVYRECLIEHGKTVPEAESKLWQRLDGLKERKGH